MLFLVMTVEALPAPDAVYDNIALTTEAVNPRKKLCNAIAKVCAPVV